MEKPEKMKIAGVICELNPLHRGHALLLDRLRQDHDAVVCVLSGNFVQRGEPAILDKWARAELALSAGADLVIELPLSWACAGAERFAAGGVALLTALGCVDTLAFGSEVPDAGRLDDLARVLLSPDFSRALAAVPDAGEPFARRRERAAAALLGEEAARILRKPNAILGVEYCKALRAQGSPLRPLALPRVGAAHDQPGGAEGLLSAAALREKLRAGESLAGLVPEATLSVLGRERAAGRAPADLRLLERSILCKLRELPEETFAALPEISEGLDHRLYAAARQAGSLEELYARVKTKRYAHARIRRTVLHAFLGVTADLPALPPYLRLLGLTARGKEILHRAAPALPLTARAADLERLGEEGRRVFALECRADDLYALACPVPPPCGRDFTERIIRY